jgi:cytochrome P450
MLTLADPSLIADPYPFYRRLREDHPIFWDERVKAFLLARHDDVLTALRAPQASARRVNRFRRAWPDPLCKEMRPLTDSLELWTLFQDPPDHTRLRALLTRAFTPRLVEAMRPRIQAYVDRMLDAAADRGCPFDIIADLAHPLPATVILEMLGVPTADRDQFRAWSDHIAHLLGGAQGAGPDAARAAAGAMDEMRSYFRRLFARRRSDPAEDLISAMIAAHDRSDVRGEEELLANCVMLMFGGQETTTNLIGNGTLALLRHPEQRAQLAADPTLLPSAIEELLRYDSPVQVVGRTLAGALEVAGTVLPPGTAVMPLLGAANRDPLPFPDPDRLDVTRRPRQVAFGFGIHFCIGAALARIQGAIAIGATLERFPRMRLADEAHLTWRPTLVLRGLTALQVAVA